METKDSPKLLIKEALNICIYIYKYADIFFSLMESVFKINSVFIKLVKRQIMILSLTGLAWL